MLKEAHKVIILPKAADKHAACTPPMFACRRFQGTPERGCNTSGGAEAAGPFTASLDNHRWGQRLQPP